MSSVLDAIFSPRSIAVIGASRQRHSIGWQLLDNIMRCEYDGMVFPVNPKADVIHSIKCYRSVLDVPAEIDLAIVVVPKQFVPSVMEECGKKGVKGAIIISAGFKETGGKGSELEDRTMEIAKRYGIRVVGPNCMGIINTHPKVRMNATFAPTWTKPGKMAFISQSGALGIAILEYIDELNMGVSKFVSIGNRADVSVNDILEYLENDDETEIILLYLESFGNPIKFTRIAKRITKHKPIIAVKAGRTTAGARAASSHTGALAGADIAVDALFEETGVIRATSVEELFDFALAFIHQPAPRGRNIAILTNGGGPGILATDAAVSLGLEIASFSEATMRRLMDMLPEEASVHNPVDLIASANEHTYQKAIEIVLSDEGVDALIAIFIPPLQTDPLVVADAMTKSSEGFDKPVLGVFMGREDVLEGVQRLEGRKIPIYLFPESAVKALRFMAHYEELRNMVHGPEEFDATIDAKAVRGIINRAATEGRSTLDLFESMEMLRACGLATPGYGLANDPDSAVAVAKGIGYPVALKVVSERLTHKSDVGGVALAIPGPEELREEVRGMLERASRALGGDTGSIRGILVQEMVESGREVVIGVNRDPLFGPLVMFGLGGIYVEVMKDVSFKIAPVSREDARDMIRKIKGYPILAGVRGEKGVDIELLVDAVTKASELALAAPCITEIDINPLVALPDGKCVALDARVMLDPNSTPAQNE